ncbi:MAG: DUF4312 family protein [Anaerolineaceae bacterium]|jgi:uncharacterized protein (TIGR03578 family)|nr:DUF4312 family protein [Anaerolineaceae bacterium]
MTEKNQLISVKKTFQLTGKGKSEEEAYTEIFAKVKRAVYDSVEGVVLQMEPEEVYITAFDESVEKEKFLFLFFPREKRRVSIDVKLVVSLKYLATKE